MEPVYEELSFVRNAEALWRKLEEGRWDWLGVKPDGQFVLGSPCRPTGPTMFAAAMVTMPADANTGQFGYSIDGPSAPASGSWFATEEAARSAFAETVAQLRQASGAPSLQRVTLWINHELEEEEFIVNNPSTYAGLSGKGRVGPSNASSNELDDMKPDVPTHRKTNRRTDQQR